MTTPAAPRQRCYRCLRPTTMCLCASIPSIPTRTKVVVLQHPHERTHPFGTAKLVKLGLPNSSLHTISGGVRRELHCPLDVACDAVLLYPHPDAIDLADLGPDDRPSTVVVLDGTWAHSRQLYRHNPWLQQLRHVRITPTEPSRYRIRKEPQPDYISTLEAIVLALRALEPDAPDFQPLLDAFDHMIDRQIAHTSSRPRQVRQRRPRQRTSCRTSPLLYDPRLVLLYAESSRPGGDAGEARQLIQLVAARRGNGDGYGEIFEVILRPFAAPPTPDHLGHMGLTTEDLDAGCTLEQARDRLQQFVGGDPVASWTPGTLDWAAPLLPAEHERFVLKRNYCNLRQRNPGKLDVAVEHEGLELPAVDCRGRARRRLAGALAMTDLLRQLGKEAGECV